jgi:hypothetical protein
MKATKTWLTACLLFACVLLTVAPSSAGTTGVLSGYVFDSDGRTPHVNATVAVSLCRDFLVYDWSCTEVDQRQTDIHGRYVFISLGPGYYSVYASVASTRLGSPCRTQATVDANSTTFANLDMNDFSKCICDCFDVVYFRPTGTSSIYSFDASGNLEH